MIHSALALLPLLAVVAAGDEPPPAAGPGEYATVTITSSGAPKGGGHIRAGALLVLDGEGYKGTVAERLGFAGRKGRFVVLMARVGVGGTEVSAYWFVDRSEKLDKVVVDDPNPARRGRKLTVDGAEYYIHFLVDAGESKGLVAQGQLYAPAPGKGRAATPLEGVAIPALFCPREKVRLYDPSDPALPKPGYATVEGTVVAGDFRYDGGRKSKLAVRNDPQPIVLVPGLAKDIPGQGRVQATGRLQITDAGQTWLVVDEVKALEK